MAKGTLDKATAIKSILSDLKKGIDRATILHKIAQKCTKDGSTLRRWYAEAEKQYNEFRAKVEPIEIQKTAELEAEAGILSKAQALKILSDLAMTAERDSDKVAAVKTMADFQGWKAIVKPDPIEAPEEITEIKITRIGSKS